MVWYVLTYVSEELIASIIRAILGQYLIYYTVQNPREYPVFGHILSIILIFEIQ